MDRKSSIALAVLLLLVASPACKKPGKDSGEKRASREAETQPAKPAQPPTASADQPVEGDLAELVAGQNDFVLGLYGILREEKGNLAFSPASVRVALAMTYAGARRDTAVEMKNALRLKLTGKRLHRAYESWLDRLASTAKSEGTELSMVNRLWADSGLHILADFSAIPAKQYGAPVEQLDFIADLAGSIDTINAWVEEKTHDRIKDLLAPGSIGEGTRLVLTNAVYFAGTWAEKFDPEETTEAPFYAPSGEVKAPMMHRTGDYRAAESPGLRVLSIPYQGEALSMVILLPDARDGLPALEAKLSGGGLDERLAGLSERRVAVSLPRFTLEASFQLSSALSKMGMPSAFTAGKADFSGITGNRDIFLSAVFHKTFVEVDEKGTEAAAATAGVVQDTAMPTKLMQFVADHPFVFLIRDERTGSILFMGRVSEPGAA